MLAKYTPETKTEKATRLKAEAEAGESKKGDKPMHLKFGLQLRLKVWFFFFRSYTLPRGCKMEDVTSNLSADGVLMITAAKTESIQDGSRKVPIEMKKRT